MRFAALQILAERCGQAIGLVLFGFAHNEAALIFARRPRKRVDGVEALGHRPARPSDMLP